MNIDHIAHIAAASGGILYVMAVLLLVALTVIMERAWYLNRLIRSGTEVADRVAGLSHIDHTALAELVERAGTLPQAGVLQVPLLHPNVQDHTRLSDLLEEAILWQVPRVDKHLWMLDTIITLAPLLGLLGTIIGMFNAFHVLSNPGAAPTKVTGGVGEALIATASGLFIAIIGLVCFNGLNNRVRRIVHQLETVKFMLINRLDGAESSNTVPFRENPTRRQA
ncbi:MAG TPA: MotA/TolQ/ExbB proton channel family protein [Gammaproteobacteria bacterium]|nr:MotA/TolQ/ExbB proton channel family protein [Gammaproteobacteria bacterium]